MVVQLYHRRGGTTFLYPTPEEIEIIPISNYEAILNVLLGYGPLSKEEIAKRTNISIDKVEWTLKNQILKYKMAQEIETDGIKQYSAIDSTKFWIGTPRKYLHEFCFLK